jgi:hypothetical protein
VHRVAGHGLGRAADAGCHLNRCPISGGLEPETLSAIADRAGATWDSDARDTLLADVARARRAAKRRGQEEFGWMRHGRDAYRLRLTVSASTAHLARDEAVLRLGDLPVGLRLEELHAVAALRPTG